MKTKVVNWHNGMPLFQKLDLKNDGQLRKKLVSLYQQGKGQPTIAKELGVHLQTIYKAFKRLKIDTRSFSEGNLIHVNNRDRADLSLFQKEVLYGLLLGDGHLTKYAYTASYKQSCKHKTVLVEISKLLNNLQHKISKRVDKPSEFRLSTIAYADLTPEWKYWYKLVEPIKAGKWINKERIGRGSACRGKKLVPSNLKLTPTICYWWFIGDGTAGKSELKLCTNGFSKLEVIKLRDKLAKQLCLPVSALRLDNPGPDQFVLVLKSQAADKFLKYIGPCHTPCYAYKWDRRRHNKNHKTESASKFCEC